MFERHGIPYALGGSVASSALGEPRSTLDVDIAAAMDEPRLARLLEEMRASFYVPEESAMNAVRTSSSFNALPNDHDLKVDIFVLGDNALDRWQLERRVRLEVLPGTEIWVTAPDVLILRKLDWYRIGDEASDRQWRDVVGLIAIQGPALDRERLAADAKVVGLDRLLRRAVIEADEDR